MADFFLGYNAKGQKLWRGSKYKYVDLRGKIPGNAQPSQGTVYKDLGVIAHWNGPAVRQTDIDQLYIDARYHIQKDWGGGYYTNGIQYEWAVGADGTKYRLRNPGASLWHCGEPQNNKRAFAVTFLFGEGQHATQAAKKSMYELCSALLDIQGLSRAYMKGHLDVSSSACPGTAYPEFVVPFRKGEDFGTGTPTKPKPQPTDKVRWVNYVYHPDDGWGRKIATAMAEAGFAVGVRGGLTEKAAKAAADAREQTGVYTFLVGSDAVDRAKKYQKEFTDKDIAYNTSGAVRVVTPSYRNRAKWRIADFCEEFGLDKRVAIGAFEAEMKEEGGGEVVEDGSVYKSHKWRGWHKPQSVKSSGTYIERAPTRWHTHWDERVADLAKQIEQKWPGVSCLTYIPGHPLEDWAIQNGQHSVSFDVWDKRGRGYPLDATSHEEIFDYVFNRQSIPIRYVIKRSGGTAYDWMWVRGTGWEKYYSGYTHSNHPHFTFALGPRLNS